MSDQANRQGALWAISLTLLMVVGAAAANEDHRLVDAARNQDVQQVRALLGGHADVNVRSEDGSTALYGPRIGTISERRNCWCAPGPMPTQRTICG